MSHNRIYNVLKHLKLAKTEPKKSNLRKYIRYQRRHSNSLWHTDLFLPNGRNTIAYLDDASRLVMAIVQYNHGTPFISLPRETCPLPEINVFQAKLKELKIQYIKARIKHPQSNGKVERIIQTLLPLVKHFGSWEGAVEYYNYHRPHMSLNNGSLRTPMQAFNDKQMVTWSI